MVEREIAKLLSWRVRIELSRAASLKRMAKRRQIATFA
jgi:hypothetical protein